METKNDGNKNKFLQDGKVVGIIKVIVKGPSFGYRSNFSNYKNEKPKRWPTSIADEAPLYKKKKWRKYDSKTLALNKSLTVGNRYREASYWDTMARPQYNLK